MAYKVLITEDAEADLDRYLFYLLFIKKNEQAAKNVPKNFQHHRYFTMYRIDVGTVYIDNIFHILQDHENKIY